MNTMAEIINILVEKGKNAFEKDRTQVPFTRFAPADTLLNNIEQYPHIFVLGCISDLQMSSEGAWMVGYNFCEPRTDNGDFKFGSVLGRVRSGLVTAFGHRFPDKIQQRLISAMERIDKKYNGNASNIWQNNPIGATVVRRFLEFDGVGLKIANMATNILVRDFKIQMRNLYTVDVAVDGNVRKVFKRLGLVDKDTTKNEIIMYTARELYPDYPGLIDGPLWEIGRNWCHGRSKPECSKCYMRGHCPEAKRLNL
jgi:endonuclease III